RDSSGNRHMDVIDRSSATQERNATILRMWLHEGKSQKQISAEFGISRQWVREILKEMGADRCTKPQRGTAVKIADQRVISTLHSQIGQAVNYARQFTQKKSVDLFAAEVRLSRQRLRKIEAGVEEPTLSELLRLSQAIGISLDKLVVPRNGTRIN